MPTKNGRRVPGPLVRFDAPRAADGRLRIGRWDRGMTFGVKVKDDDPTEFSVETFGQMIDNWKARGEKLAYCYNHQSAYVEQNGQPAPSLAYANAVAVVQGGQVVRFEKLLLSDATPPDVAELQQQVMALATDDNPRPTPDGCWFYRYEHTPLGEVLLSSFAFLSPLFHPEGQDEEGNAVGYQLYDLAATNTPFQAGCLISFERGAGGVTMHVSISQLAPGDKVGSADGSQVGEVVTVSPDRVLIRTGAGDDKWFTGRDLANLHKLEGATRRETAMTKNLLASFAAQMKVDGANKTKVRALYSRKLREAQGALRLMEARRIVIAAGKKFEGPEAEAYADDAAEMKRFEEEGPAADAKEKGAGVMAAKCEEMAKHFEDAYEADEDDDEPHHVSLRRLAKKFRRLAAMEETPADPPAAMEAEDAAAMTAMARSLGLSGAPRPRDIARAYEAKTAPLTEVATLKGEVTALSQRLAERDTADKKTAAKLFSVAAVKDGRTTEEKQASVESAYVEGGEKKAEELLFAKGTFTALRRFANDKGDPLRANQRPEQYAQDTPEELEAKYVAKATEIAAKEKITYAAATARIKALEPSLHQAVNASRRGARRG